MLLSLLALSVTYAQTIPAGDPVDRAVSMQITRDGLDSFGEILPALVPEQIPIDDVYQSGGGGFCLTEYEFFLGDAFVQLVIEDVRMVPRTGILDVEVDLLVNINNSGSPFDFNFEGLCISGDCAGWVRPFPVTASLPFQMAVVTNPDGTRSIDATVGQIGVNNGLNNTHIELTESCGTLDTVDSVLALAGLSIYDFILDLANPLIVSAIQDQAEGFEETIEEALSSARFEDTVSLSGADLNILVEPRDIDITPYGIQIDLLGSISADAAECITRNDPGGSLSTPSDVPHIDDNPAGTEMIIQLSDEFANQGLYGVWRSGVLCYEISGEDGDIDVGFPINSNLLGILGGDAFEELLPEEQPLAIRTDPREAPTINYEGAYDLTAEVRELGVDFYTQIDSRQARALGLTIEADAGIDLVFNATTGVLAADVALGPENIRAYASHNELVPDATADIEESFAGLLEVLLDSLVGDALSGISFGLPAFEGVGLDSASVSPTGDGDWAGIAATIGPVTYESGGCADGGCSGGTSSGGCSSAAGGLGAAFFLLPLLLVRRRRS